MVIGDVSFEGIFLKKEFFLVLCILWSNILGCLFFYVCLIGWYMFWGEDNLQSFFEVKVFEGLS